MPARLALVRALIGALAVAPLAVACGGAIAQDPTSGDPPPAPTTTSPTSTLTPQPVPPPTTTATTVPPPTSTPPFPPPPPTTFDRTKCGDDGARSVTTSCVTYGRQVPCAIDDGRTTVNQIDCETYCGGDPSQMCVISYDTDGNGRMLLCGICSGEGNGG